MFNKEYISRENYKKAITKTRIVFNSEIQLTQKKEDDKNDVIEVIYLDKELLKPIVYTENNSFFCPVCYLKKMNTRIYGCSCGHKICFTCISKWTKVNSTCPICRKKI